MSLSAAIGNIKSILLIGLWKEEWVACEHAVKGVGEK